VSGRRCLLVKYEPEQTKIKVQIRSLENDGVLLGFSQNKLKRESTQIATKNCTMRAHTVIKRVYLHSNQSLTTPMSQELEGSPQNHKRWEGRNQEHKTSEF
jgi:hypothetical protein